MSRNGDTRDVIGVWFKQRGRTAEWSRAINPPGELLHTTPPSLRLFVYDSAIEDNEPQTILAALEPAIEHRLSECINVTINAELAVVVQ